MKGVRRLEQGGAWLAAALISARPSAPQCELFVYVYHSAVAGQSAALAMSDKDALDLTAMTDVEDRSDTANMHQRRKRRVSGGALSKQDLEAGLLDLAARLEKSFEKLSTDVAKELV
eukprot:2903293-Amphidinium_carterae.2